MTSELTADQQERWRIENEIARLRAEVHPFPTLEHITARQRHIQDLTERLRQLPPLPREYSI